MIVKVSFSCLSYFLVEKVDLVQYAVHHFEIIIVVETHFEISLLLNSRSEIIVKQLTALLELMRL